MNDMIVAKALKDMRPDATSKDYVLWHSIVEHVMQEMQLHTPRFDAAAFELKAGLRQTF
jgi:hypothetical protein